LYKYYIIIHIFQWGVITIMNKETKILYELHKSFFKSYFQNEEELERFLLEKITCSKDDIPRRMINTVHRLVVLSDDMIKVRSGSRDLTIFFILTCIETLYTLVPDLKMKKQDIIIDFFEKYLCENDKEKIQTKISILVDDHDTPSLEDPSIEQFALLLIAVRNNLAHEGVYWKLHFEDESSEDSMLHTFKSKLKKDGGFSDITYEIGITYKEFRLACMRAFINFINDYYRTHCLSD